MSSHDHNVARVGPDEVAEPPEGGMVIVTLCQAYCFLLLDLYCVSDDGIGAVRKFDLALAGVELLGNSAQDDAGEEEVGDGDPLE